ncbi:MAG: hypothetical protein IKF51_06980 [Solobacterium sp.]|nr:hypothetical protein [Solobacterium sp.]
MKIKELSDGILKGEWTSEQLAETALRRIADNDQDGRKLNTVAEINPNVLFEARAMDEEIRRNGLKSPLHGVPVLLKDNIDVRGMHTTASSYALSDLIAEKDAFLVKQLREAGALILGKTNLSEFAYFMSRQDMPSGYGSLNGQVIHAYDPERNPSGSSSGSAVAASARFVPYTIGTETDGSLMSPGIANAIVSLKPTAGLVSRSGILPISHIQDTAGPMGTSVEDIARVLSCLAGRDEEDPATWSCRRKDYIAALTAGVQGMRIGIYRTGDDAEEEQTALKRAAEILEEAGAVVVEAQPETLLLSETDCLMHEFKQGLNLYLSQHSSACRTLADIIRFNKEHAERCLKYGQDLLEGSDALSGTLKESEYIRMRAELKQAAAAALQGTMKQYDVQCLLGVMDQTKINLAPVSGSPCMCIPAVNMDDRDFRPLSYYLLADHWAEDILIRTAAVLEQKLNITARPSWVQEFRAES